MSGSASVEIVRVLEVFLESAGQPQYGPDIAEQLDIGSRRLYPVLGKLERSGWVTSSLEDEAEASSNELGGRRRLYRLNALGERSARALLDLEGPKPSAPDPHPPDERAPIHLNPLPSGGFA